MINKEIFIEKAKNIHDCNIVSIWENDWNAQVKANKLKDKSNAI